MYFNGAFTSFLKLGSSSSYSMAELAFLCEIVQSRKSNRVLIGSSNGKALANQTYFLRSTYSIRFDLKVNNTPAKNIMIKS